MTKNYKVMPFNIYIALFIENCSQAAKGVEKKMDYDNVGTINYKTRKKSKTFSLRKNRKQF